MDGHHILRGQKAGAWISVVPSMANSMDIRTQELRNTTFLQYCIKPPDLTRNCDVCGVGFWISHAIDWKKGFLITSRHNKLGDRVTDLIRNHLSPTHVHDKPLINPGHAIRIRRATPDGSHLPNNPPVMVAYPKHKVDLLI